MTVPFENDTGNIVRKLARKSLKSEKRRNLMVVIAVALASCLICFSIVMALSTRQIEKNHVEDTYEAVYTRITEEDVSTLKGLDDFSRVGEYYMLAVEPAEQGYNASYIYCDEETMYIARDQMKLLEGRLPQKEDEVVVSRYFLSNYGADAGIGEKVMLSSESFHGEYTVTGILEGYKEKEVNGTSILLSKEALKGWSGQLHRFYRRLVQNDVIHIETFVTKQAHHIYSHIDGFSRNQRVVFKIIYTRKCQTIQFDRRTREMRKETDIERFKIELGIQHLIGLFFHNSYHFVFKHKWQDKHEYQDNRHGYSGNLQSFFQTFVHHSYYLFVVLLFFLPQLFCNSPMTSGHIGHFQLDKSISESIVRRSM